MTLKTFYRSKFLRGMNKKLLKVSMSREKNAFVKILKKSQGKGIISIQDIKYNILSMFPIFFVLS